MTAKILTIVDPTDRADGRTLVWRDADSAHVYEDFAGLSNPMTTVGDLIRGGASGAPTRLAAVATGKVLASAGVGTSPAWGYPPFHGCRVRHSTTQTVTSFATTPLLCDTEDYDTDTYHFTSGSALTGTVAKAAASADLVGTGTAFTTELTVNQVISIPGTATEIGVVKLITDNTHLTLWQTMANTASGQTATRRNEFVAVPVGLGGKYRISGGARWTTVTTAKVDVIHLGLNGSLTASGTAMAVQGSQSVTSSVNFLNASTPYSLAEGDYIGVYFNNQESSTVTITNGVYSFLSAELIGV